MEHFMWNFYHSCLILMAKFSLAYLGKDMVAEEINLEKNQFRIRLK